jgi:hypothetical protein
VGYTHSAKKYDQLLPGEPLGQGDELVGARRAVPVPRRSLAQQLKNRSSPIRVRSACSGEPAALVHPLVEHPGRSRVGQVQVGGRGGQLRVPLPGVSDRRAVA